MNIIVDASFSEAQFHIMNMIVDTSFSDAQFHIEGYHYLPFRQDRGKNIGGKVIFIRESLITKRL